MKPTRVFSLNGERDITLCDEHMNTRVEAGDEIGVPLGAMAYMMGFKPWPTGNEPCEDCK